VVLTVCRVAVALALAPIASIFASLVLAYTVPRRLAEKHPGWGWAAVPVGGLLGAAAGLAAVGPLGTVLWAMYGPSAPEEPFSFRTLKEARRHAIPREREVRANAVKERHGRALEFTNEVISDMYCHVVSPRDRPSRGILVMHHGLHSHGGAARMLEIAVYFSQKGYTVYSCDAVGHGRSHGSFGTIPALEQLAKNFAAVVDSIRGKHPRQPIFLKGASMGGLIVLWSTFFMEDETREEGLKGIISVCPALTVGDAAKSKFLIEFFKFLPVHFLANFVFPKLPLTKGPRGVSFSEDPELRRLAEEESDADPMEYKGRLKFATALTFTLTLMEERASAYLVKLLQTVETPLLMQHGTGDKTVDVGGSRTFIAGVKADKKSLIEYQGKSHVLLSEDEKTREKYLSDMFTFVNKLL